jgi:hypothetical protein
MKLTSIDAEEKAYNTPSGTQWGSNRRAEAICPDGRVRTFTCGVPDTTFSVPAHTRIKGRLAVGYLSLREHVNGEQELFFTETLKGCDG